VKGRSALQSGRADRLVGDHLDRLSSTCFTTGNAVNTFGQPV
jgi:hypothetical protein